MIRKLKMARAGAVCAAALAWTLAAGAQAGGYRPPRTTFGAPDFQGVWTNLSLTQLERPSDAKTLILDEAEAAAVEQHLQTLLAGPIGGVGLPDPVFRDDPHAHFARIDGRVRSSWLTEPDDGHLPFNAEGAAEYKRRSEQVLTAFDGPEARDMSERCLIVGVGQEAPILNQNYSANYQILQTPTEVAIYYEINHEVRIVRMNGRHPPKTVHVWMGDSIGHWDGDTLVVETTNFRADEAFRQDYLLSADAKVTERFTRISPTEIRYAFLVEDPKFYSRPWRGEMPFFVTKARMFEDTCHEGNYSLPTVLAGARKAEAEHAAPAR